MRTLDAAEISVAEDSVVVVVEALGLPPGGRLSLRLLPDGFEARLGARPFLRIDGCPADVLAALRGGLPVHLAEVAADGAWTLHRDLAVA